MKRIVIKIGSRVLAKKNGLLNKKIISDLVRDIAKIKKEKNIEVAIITSGAVAVGKANSIVRNMKVDAEAVSHTKETVHEQVLAAIGQPKLIGFYAREFEKYGMSCAQILTTRNDFADRDKYLSLRTVTKNLLQAGVVPIFNENDVLSPEELDFSDNDQLAGMVSAMIFADRLIILTVVDGFLDGPIDDPKTEAVPIIYDARKYLAKVDDSNISRGGMKSKLYTADLVTSLGIDMCIAHGARKNVISRILNEGKCGTLFPAKNKKQKALKNWIAAGAASRGKIRVSTILADILRDKKCVSVLFTGIEDVVGEFEKNDVIDIVDENMRRLARGISRFSSEDLANEVVKFKKKGPKQRAEMKASGIIAVHYDYLVIKR